jgi:hypothetical protein
VDAEGVWQASLTVAAAALRRVDEAGAGSLCRLVWSCATLSGWVHKTLAVAADGDAPPADTSAAQRAVHDGRVVFDQLCTALAKSWQHEPQVFDQTVSMTAWALIAAEKCGLWRPEATPMAETAGSSQKQQQQQAPPALLLQRLLGGISSHGNAGGGQQQLSAGTVGDLAAALSELKPRLESYAHLAAVASGAQGFDGQSAEQPARSGGQLLVQLSAAVDALAAVAWQHAGTHGALEVRNVSRMLTAFSHLQVSGCHILRDVTPAGL